MKRYGTKKIATHVAGHQDCGICHPPQKSHKAREREKAQREAADWTAAHMPTRGDE